MEPLRSRSALSPLRRRRLGGNNRRAGLNETGARHLPRVAGHAKRLDVARLHSGPALVLERSDAHLHQQPRVLDRFVLRHFAQLVAQETDRRAAEIGTALPF